MLGLGNLLTALTQGLTSGFSRYVTSSVLPLLLAIAAHMSLAWILANTHFEWLYQAVVKSDAKQAAITLIFFFGAAHLLSNLHTLLLQTLEGNLPQFIVRIGHGIHLQRVESIQARLEEAAEQLAGLQRRVQGTQAEPDALLSSRRYSGDLIRETQMNNEPQRAEVLVDYARNRWRQEQITLDKYLSFTYPSLPNYRPGEAESAVMLAPTTLGNIGRTMRAYALSRYSLDLDLLWTRLQRTVNNAAGTDKFAETLANARAQLEYAVAMVFLSAGLCIGWTLFLAWDIRGRWIPFILIAGWGPAIAVLFYKLACRNYMVFADHVRTAVDCYRLELLKDLKLPAPRNTREEQRLWEEVGNRLGYGNRVGFTNREQ